MGATLCNTLNFNALEIDGGSTATHSKAVSAWDWMAGRDGAAENTVVYLCLIG